MAVYNEFKSKIQDGTIDLDTDDIRVALLTSAYTPDIDTHHTWGDISANEVSGSNYTAGGEQLTTVVITTDDANDLSKFDADDVTWQTSTITAQYAVVYYSSGGTDTWLVSYYDFGEDKISENGDFKVQWSTGGLLQLS